MKTAVVTGASRGMGLEWCRQLAERGYRVVLTARSEEKAERAAAPLRAAGGEVLGRALDVGDERSIAAFAARLENDVDQLDLLVNNAGINPKDHPDPEVFAKTFHIEKLDPEPVLETIRINAIMPIVVVKHLLSLLEAAERAVVVQISSWLGSIEKKSSGGHYGYATSKTTLNMMNRALALQVKDRGIVAVAVNPGWVQTAMGGAKAKLTPEASIRGMLDNVVDRVGPEDAGAFLQWDGSHHPW